MEKNAQPDVLVKWKRNGTVNIVNLKDLQITSKQKHIKKGTRVRMRGRHTWWAGKIIDIVGQPSESDENDEDEDEDHVPLVLLANQLQGVPCTSDQGQGVTVTSEAAYRPILAAQTALTDVDQANLQPQQADQLQGGPCTSDQGQGVTVTSEAACRPILAAQTPLMDVDQAGGSSACFELLYAVPLDFTLKWDDVYSIPNKELEHADIPDAEAMQPHTNATSARIDDRSEESEEEMSTSSDSEGACVPYGVGCTSLQ